VMLSRRSRWQVLLKVPVRETGDKHSLADSLLNLGMLVYDERNYVAARGYIEESLRLRREMGDKRGIAESLNEFASLASGQAQPERALRLAGAAATLRALLGTPLAPAEQDRLDRWLQSARAALSAEAGVVAWAEGHAMTLEQAIGYALGETGPE
jgi:hypothetical protein